jgi:hypothetical protein
MTKTDQLPFLRNIGATVVLVHTIQKCKEMAGQNTFQIMLLNDANTIREH